jgi:betaine-aldehyde dehydrogenase
MGFIESAKAEGAQLLTGGGKPADASLAAGLFIAPTVFDKVTPAMRIGHEEIFGPVMSVMAWDNYEDMLTKVNGVEYGLTAAIVTNDLARSGEVLDCFVAPLLAMTALIQSDRKPL